MATNARRGIEIELSYTLVEPTDLGWYLTAERFGPFAASPAARPLQVEDRYVDTVDGGLARAGFAARLRRGRDGTILSVKSQASTGGGALQRRAELEGAADISLDAASWPPSTARALVLELCGDAPLGEIVTIRQLRRRRDLRADDAKAEASLDEVEIVSRGNVVARFSEIEIELIDGDEQRLREVEDALSSDRRLVPSGRSKFERALEAIGLIGPHRQTGNRLLLPAIEDLVGRPREEAVRRVPDEGKSKATAAASRSTGGAAPKGPGVRGDDTLPEAGRKVLGFHFQRLLDREAGVREGRDPGELKSMRVATRRMRAAWRVFGDAFRRSRTGRIRSRLRDAAGRLGAVRDLDVLIDELEEYREGLPSGHSVSLEPLVSAWRSERDAKREELVRLLDSDEYAELVAGYREFLDADVGSVARRRRPPEPWLVRETASSRIWAAEEHVRAFEPLVGSADVPTLHQLRIATKRLRYTIEFFREALGPDAASLVERCVAVQDHLGALNDAHVTAGLVRDFLGSHVEDLSTGEIDEVTAYLASREADMERLRSEFAAPWEALIAAEFRQGLGRAVSAL